MNDAHNDLKSLGHKLEELKNLFSVGERIIPGIQKLVDFINEMRPMLSHINESIEESSSKIPKATDHIVDIASATELATTEILNLIDEITSNTFQLADTFKEILQKEEENKKLLHELTELVSDNLRAKEIVEELLNNFTVSKLNDKITDALNKITTDSTNIAIALQVQDITSQQLSAVNHLIISVQKRLTSLMFDLSNDGIKSVDNSNEIVVPTDSNFDMEASFINQQTSQDEVDKLVGSSNIASQDEIDKLFG
jgi:chemotaxis regulatin CheY-phosphate phosphatase CheZ